MARLPAYCAIRSDKGAVLRILAIVVLLWFASGPVLARDCRPMLEDSTTSSLAANSVPPRDFYLCLLAEIAELKARQAELEKLIPETRRLKAEIPAHYSNDNGRIAFEKGRAIGSANFVLKARQLGGASSLKLDRAVVDHLCSAPGGCSVTLTLRAFSLVGEEVQQADVVGPCQLRLNAATRAWSLAAGCGADRPVSGRDGDGSTTRQGSGAEILVEAGPGCLWSDADIKSSGVGAAPEYSADSSAGFFLVADPSRRSGGQARYECDLALD